MTNPDLSSTDNATPPVVSSVQDAMNDISAQSPLNLSALSLFQRRGAKSTLAALGVVALAIMGAGTYHRTVPPPPQADPRILVAPAAVGFAKGSPHWEQVKVGQVAPAAKRWTDPFPAHVRVDETKASRVGAPLAGRVAHVMVQVGQRVTVGTPLFSVASSDLATLQTERMKAEVELTTARMALDRVKSIVQAQALPAKDEVMAAQQLKEAELTHRVSQSRLASLKVQPVSDNEYVVKSPRNGVVVEKTILPDQEIADTNSSPVVVADVSSVWVIAELFESDTAGIRPGTHAKVIVDTASLDAQVDNVAAAVDPERHTVAVRITLPNTDGSLRPNTFARVQFETELNTGAAEIVAAALVSDGAKQYVYVVRADGLFERRDVVVGPVREGRALIVSGLRVGEKIAEQGAVLIDNQMAISQ